MTVISFSNASSDYFNLDAAVARHELDLERPSARMQQAIKNNIRRIRALRTVLCEIAPDVVVSFMDQVNVLTLLASFNLGLPVVVSERIDPRAMPIKRVWSALRKLMYRQAKAVVVQTEGLRAWANRFTSPGRVWVIPNTVDWRFTGNSAVGGKTRQYKKEIVAMGWLTEQKGFDLLLGAFAQVSECKDNWMLLIIGDGPERPTLIELARELGIEKQVKFVGIVSTPWKLIKNASLFVLSSRYEGFPNVLIEAMACGVPVISFDCPSGPSEIIEDGVNGVLVPPGEVGKLASAMERLMINGTERYRLASKGKHDAKQYTMDKVMPGWEELLERVSLNC